jgi:hypothetical protein
MSSKGGADTAQCPNHDRCELFPLISKGGFLRVWQVSYCEADYTRCERYKRSRCGEGVSPTLLPNGQDLLANARTQKKER